MLETSHTTEVENRVILYPAPQHPPQYRLCHPPSPTPHTSQRLPSVPLRLTAASQLPRSRTRPPPCSEHQTHGFYVRFSLRCFRNAAKRKIFPPSLPENKQKYNGGLGQGRWVAPPTFLLVLRAPSSPLSLGPQCVSLTPRLVSSLSQQ